MHFRANFSAESFDLKSLSKKIWHFLIEILKKSQKSQTDEDFDSQDCQKDSTKADYTS